MCSDVWWNLNNFDEKFVVPFFCYFHIPLQNYLLMFDITNGGHEHTFTTFNMHCIARNSICTVDNLGNFWQENPFVLQHWVDMKPIQIKLKNDNEQLIYLNAFGN